MTCIKTFHILYKIYLTIIFSTQIYKRRPKHNPKLNKCHERSFTIANMELQIKTPGSLHFTIFSEAFSPNLISSPPSSFVPMIRKFLKRSIKKTEMLGPRFSAPAANTWVRGQIAAFAGQITSIPVEKHLLPNSGHCNTHTSFCCSSHSPTANHTLASAAVILLLKTTRNVSVDRETCVLFARAMFICYPRSVSNTEETWVLVL